MNDSQKWLALSLLVLCGWLLYLLAPVLTPFLVGALLAYLGDPLVDRLEAAGLGRTPGVVVVFVVMLLLGVIGLVVLLPNLQRQVVMLLNAVPQLLEWLQQSLLPRLSAMFDVELVEFDVSGIRKAILAHWQEVGSFATVVVDHLGRSGALILGWVSYLLLIPVVTFYLLRDWDLLVAAVRDLLPKRIEPVVSKLAAEIDAVLAEFLRGQVTVMAALATIYTLGLWLVGLDLAFSIGMLAGVVSFVPYLGVIVGVLVAGVAAFLQFHDMLHLLGVAAVFGVGQVLEGMVLSPLLVGDRIGLHPVAVIFAVMAGGQLFGFFGVLLALPVAAVIIVLLRHSRDEYLRSALYE
ncbi:MAG: AI-2E family transporter [Gammaproteobacteria bacterium]|nr:AI-2E family transporter [Gammaproteobacteria bacterium]MCP5199352.1 AI-2E family transporter [Gammaproteobacteria bacterium]